MPVRQPADQYQQSDTRAQHTGDSQETLSVGHTSCLIVEFIGWPVVRNHDTKLSKPHLAPCCCSHQAIAGRPDQTASETESIFTPMQRPRCRFPAPVQYGADPRKSAPSVITSRSVRKTVERRKPWSVGPSPPQTCLAVWVAREGSRDKIQGNVTPSVTISPEFPNNTNSLQTRE